MKSPWSRSHTEWLFIVCSVIVLYAQYVPYGLGFNNTTSIPRGLYLTEKISSSDSLKHGDAICFVPDFPGWAKNREYLKEGQKLCKYIGAKGGDQIFVEGRSIRVVSSKYPGGLTLEALENDSKGRPLTQASLPAVIPDGSFFIEAHRSPRSLDSRYLGLISGASISHKVYNLITLSDD